MKIYTKVGDAGQTSLFGGTKVSKADLRIRAYGGLDELNAFLGLAVTELSSGDFPAEIQKRLQRVQEELFQLGAELATPPGKNVGIPLIDENDVKQLEIEIDEMDERLAPMKNFILPGGTKFAAFTHVARTVCRRTERDLVSLEHSLQEANPPQSLRPVVIQYINRLSDYLFVTARWINFLSNVQELPWKPRHTK